jgi:hypothetical protein
MRTCLRDIQPTLDILSSATQAPDVGAKLLLIYCCLEHLFVPSRIAGDNKKYILVGINAVSSELIPWFDRLYKLRCSYAHKGYVVHDNQIWPFMRESMMNVLSLLVAKLRDV